MTELPDESPVESSIEPAAVEPATASPAGDAVGIQGLGGRGVRVIGVDPGSNTTGYGVVDSDGRKYQLVEYAGIRAPVRFSFAERLLIICQKLEEVFARLRPQACAVEETFYAVNVKTALKLGHVRGAILVTAARAGIPVFEYSPLEIKSALVGYGRAEKQQVQEMVRLLLKLKELPEPLDASDALGAAICHINIAATQRRMR